MRASHLSTARHNAYIRRGKCGKSLRADSFRAGHDVGEGGFNEIVIDPVNTLTDKISKFHGYKIGFTRAKIVALRKDLARKSRRGYNR